jgi:flavin-dependent dehydrogenase
MARDRMMASMSDKVHESPWFRWKLGLWDFDQGLVGPFCSVERHYDVAIIGGGPAGSTTASILKKYNPGLSVAVFERETFPRDHIGESLLPPISQVLYEMGAWDKIEAANFPIKVGATYRWGRRPELWDFEFVPVETFKDEERPAKFEGPRRATAFQVDRSIYDMILLDHAAELGTEVRQNTKIAKVSRDGNRVTGLTLASGEEVTAKYYVDASGNSGIFSRAMNVKCDYPSTLRNIAIYDYWQNAEWAVKIGVGGTRIQVLSLGYGWIWFIPLGPTRTSIGLVIPAEYYKESGKRPEELYLEALTQEPIVAALTRNATAEGKLQTTRDWSFLAERHAGDNWFLVGECAGFADPIMSAGVTMAHLSARQLAYTILELERGELDGNWLKEEFSHRQTQRIQTHIRFADYWYTANEQFRELKQFTTRLAEDMGLELSPENAWDWIARGGFIDEDLNIGSGGWSLAGWRASSGFLGDLAFDSPLDQNNVIKLNLRGATWKESSAYESGRVRKIPCYVREGKVLPIRDELEILVNILQRESRMVAVFQIFENYVQQKKGSRILAYAALAIEAMIRDGWLIASHDDRLPSGKMVESYAGFRWNSDMAVPEAGAQG